MFGRREIRVLVILATAVSGAVVYGVTTYQTPYGCGGSNAVVRSPDGRPSIGSGIYWQGLLAPCFYVYFVGIVGGSSLVILLIPVPKKNKSDPSTIGMATRACRCEYP